MKQKIISIGYCMLLVSLIGHAQVQFSKIPFSQALDQAKTSNKMIALAIESAECTQCNDVASQGFANTIVGQLFNANCISVKINPANPEYGMLDSLYTIKNSFGLLFIDSDGNLLHRYGSTTSFYMKYVEQFEIAQNKKVNPDLEFKQMQTAYNAGNRSFDILYKLVGKKNETGMDHDLLTEEMLNLAPKDSASSLSFLQFLADQAPVIDSKADQYLRNNNRNFNDAWYLMPLQKRVYINSRINVKSRNKAIRDKDISFAKKVAGFTAGTYSDKIQAGKSRDKSMIDYYKGVKDTGNFLLASSTYIDQYLMTISVDSILRVDSIRKKELLAKAVPEKVPVPGAAPMMRSSIQFAPITQNYTGELNDAAWTVYTSTHDAFYTGKALTWIKRANEFYENPGAMDTYARLLYRSGKREEAIAWQEKALRVNKERRMPPAEFEEILKKMKADSEAIDKY